MADNSSAPSYTDVPLDGKQPPPSSDVDDKKKRVLLEDDEDGDTPVTRELCSCYTGLKVSFISLMQCLCRDPKLREHTGQRDVFFLASIVLSVAGWWVWVFGFVHSRRISDPIMMQWYHAIPGMFITLALVFLAADGGRARSLRSQRDIPSYLVSDTDRRATDGNISQIVSNTQYFFILAFSVSGCMLALGWTMAVWFAPVDIKLAPMSILPGVFILLQCTCLSLSLWTYYLYLCHKYSVPPQKSEDEENTEEGAFKLN